MHFPTLVVILSTLCTTPISGLPVDGSTGKAKILKRAERNQGGSSQGNNNDLMVGAGVGAGGVALLGTGSILGYLAGKRTNPPPSAGPTAQDIQSIQSKLKGLEREIQSTGTSNRDIIGKLNELARELRSGNGAVNHNLEQLIPEIKSSRAGVSDLQTELSALERRLEYQLWKIQFHQATGLKVNDPVRAQEVARKFSELPLKTRNCIFEALGFLEFGEVKDIVGKDWFNAVNKCGGNGYDLYVHLDTGLTMSRNPPTEAEKWRNQQEENQHGDDQQGNQNNFNLASVKLAGKRLLNGIGGVVNSQHKSPSLYALPAGMSGAGFSAFAAP
ncbi:MAG: hypothetical protein M1816_006274 [Peltula sp. TS41687]|nr:MAG: hypothetical protein M1816_006274 [Peltula sp. TS41687]